MHVARPDIEPHLAHAPAGEPVPFDALDLPAPPRGRQARYGPFDTSAPSVLITEGGRLLRQTPGTLLYAFVGILETLFSLDRTAVLQGALVTHL